MKHEGCTGRRVPPCDAAARVFCTPRSRKPHIKKTGFTTLTIGRHVNGQGAGGGQKVSRAFALDRRGSHAQIFFLAPQFLIQSNEIKSIKPLVSKALPSFRPTKVPIYFQGAGGGQKLCNLQSGTGRLATRIFSRICEIFFYAQRSPWALEILSRNSGWGVGESLGQ